MADWLSIIAITSVLVLAIGTVLYAGGGPAHIFNDLKYDFEADDRPSFEQLMVAHGDAGRAINRLCSSMDDDLRISVTRELIRSKARDYRRVATEYNLLRSEFDQRYEDVYILPQFFPTEPTTAVRQVCIVLHGAGVYRRRLDLVLSS